MKNLKIRTRLILGFAIVIILSIIICGIGLQGLVSVKNSYNKSYTDSVDALRYVEGISSSYWEMYTQLFSALVSTSNEDREQALKKIDDARTKITDNIRKYRAMLALYDEEEVAQEKALLDLVENSFNAFDEEINKVLKDQNYNNILRIRESAGVGTELEKLGQVMESKIRSLISYNNKYAQEQIQTNEEVARRVIIIIAAGAAVAVIVGIIVSISISRSLSKRLNSLVSASNNVAEGDVDIAIDVERNDELGEVAHAFAKMIEAIRKQAYLVQEIADRNLDVDVEIRSEKDILGKKLSELVDGLNSVFTDIMAAADHVAAGAKQMSDSSMALSQGATEQASTVEELTASLEEVSSQAKNNATNANNASEMSLSAKDVAAQGTQRMQEMLNAMDEINSSSNNINKIIKVIEDIAFQTNILALNAAVEAARAGQYGKGFAVVAEEVRTLAARSSSAAKETTELIENSIRKVGDGMKIAQSTAEALAKIVDEIGKVSNLVNEIATASLEQSLGIEQINQGINQISQVVQANSATSEESAAASQQLSGQAERLKELVSKFRLKKQRHDSDVLAMLDDLSGGAAEKVPAHKPDISLSDYEFGKY
ncbi:MAG: methyl-accepting chemotaxis protein [Oscillospiraceae bacterium]